MAIYPGIRLFSDRATEEITAVEMMLEKLTEHVEVNPKVLGGKPVIRGTRIPVYLILELLSAGYDFKRVIEAYPDLKEKDIKAAIEYATKLVKNQEVIEYV